MATKKKGKAKRKKTPVTKAARRKKSTTVRKPKTIRKKAATKAPLRRVSPKKARQAAKAAVKPTPVSRAAQTEAIRPKPSLAAPPAPPEEPGERIGVVTHYYSHPSVATIRLEWVRCGLGTKSTSAGTRPISARRSSPSKSIIRR